MGTLASAPGVLGAAVTTYVTVVDVMELLGCRHNKAYEIIRDINKTAAKDGNICVKGKANKYLFSEKAGIPIDVINAVIESNKAKGV